MILCKNHINDLNFKRLCYAHNVIMFVNDTENVSHCFYALPGVEKKNDKKFFYLM